jgi:hypothetical protein
VGVDGDRLRVPVRADRDDRVVAFNEGVLGRQTSTFTGFTTQWLSAAWNNTALRSALSVSLRAAVVVALISTAVGTLTGITLVRHRGRVLRTTLEVLVYLLLIVPEIVLAVALLLWYTKLHVSLDGDGDRRAHPVHHRARVADHPLARGRARPPHRGGGPPISARTAGRLRATCSSHSCALRSSPA